jgi:hypothetical protein
MCNGADTQMSVLVFEVAPMVRGRCLLRMADYALNARRQRGCQTGANASEPGKAPCT